MTDLQIANLALTSLGADTISSFSEDSELARKVSNNYTQIFSALIRSHPWNCAIKRVTLTSSSSTPVFGYDYYHEIPSDSLRIIALYNGTDEDDSIEDFVNEGSYIASNESTLYARYIRLPSASSLPIDLANAFAASLAAELAWPITNSAGTVQNMVKFFDDKLSIAKLNDAQESGKTFTQGEDEWINSRI